MDNEVVKKMDLDDSTNEVVNQLIESQDIEEIKRLTQLFNVNQIKKDAIRVVKLNDMLDKLDEQVLDRIKTNPDQFSNNDLLNYVNTIQQNIAKSTQNIKGIDTQPLIQFNQNNNILNVEETTLSRASRAKIIEAVKQFIAISDEENQEIIDLDLKDVVYNNEESSE